MIIPEPELNFEKEQNETNIFLWDDLFPTNCKFIVIKTDKFNFVAPFPNLL